MTGRACTATRTHRANLRRRSRKGATRVRGAPRPPARRRPPVPGIPDVRTTLAAATAALPDAQRRGDAVVVDASHDSRAVRPGWLFCAIPGANTDGHDHAPDAVTRGATALLVERWLDLDVPQVRVPSVRAVAGPVAAAIHDHPSRRLQVVGITGTNGKTSTSYLLEGAFGAAGTGTGVIGTVEVRIHGAAQAGARTTPEGPDVQRLLATMYRRGVDAVAMEVSSHALALHRVDGTRFAVAVYTNLSQDHLDFHGDMERYFAAKARLFRSGSAERAVICVDDRWGRRLAATTPLPAVTVGHHPGADHRITRVDAGLDGTALTLTGPRGPTRLRTRLLGDFSARNAACAYLAAVSSGVPPDAAAAGIAACPGVPGRLEPVETSQPYAVLVDYAHTPDALAEALAAVGSMLGPSGRLHLVVGCGGDRDRAKRPRMGRVAAHADHLVLTSDNPRSEEPAHILEDILAGVEQARRDMPRQAKTKAKVEVEVDRGAAIERALRAAVAGDIVLIAGKGHETVQEFADRTVLFDDRQVAAAAARRLHDGAGDADQHGSGASA